MTTYPYQKEARRFSHRIGLRVLETEFDKEIRPFPKKFRPPGNFAMCPYLYDHCTRFPNCTYAHNRPEQRCWNRMLKSERDANSVCVHNDYLCIININYCKIKLPHVVLLLTGKSNKHPFLQRFCTIARVKLYCVAYADRDSVGKCIKWCIAYRSNSLWLKDFTKYLELKISRFTN